jgi:NAD-dependent DNA ligase
MVESYNRVVAKYYNDLKRSAAALIGIAQGVICDRHLSDDEIRFLNEWLCNNDEITLDWPGNIICEKVRNTLADGVITDGERQHLVDTLQALIGGTIETLAAATHVSQLILDEVNEITHREARFCLTGDFVYGPREHCHRAITVRGGIIGESINKKLSYLIVGGLGSPEWKHGSYGTKVEKAMTYKKNGCPIRIVHEECWTKSLPM